MNLTNPYWSPPPIFTSGKKGQKTFENHYGFHFQIPHPDISSAGFYFGEGPVPQRQEIVTRSDPEWFATDNTISSSGGVPKYNIYDPQFAFNRKKYTKTFSTL